MHYTYILKCSDNTYYTGYTNNLQKRLNAHNEGKGAKYTKGRSPVELVYLEQYEDKHTAMRREWEIKRLTRKEKEELREQWEKTQEQKEELQKQWEKIQEQKEELQKQWAKTREQKEILQ